LLWTRISIFKCSNAFEASLSDNAFHILRSQPTIAFGIQAVQSGVRSGMEHSSPATLQQIFQSIHPYKITSVVAWAVSPIRKACIGRPCAPSISCLYTGKALRPSSRRRIRSSSGRPLFYQTASHHLTQSTKGIFARPVAVQPFQPTYPGVHSIDVPDARPRSLLAIPPSETYQQIKNSSIRITPTRAPQSSENQRLTLYILQPGDSKPG
jgi:hypothetical protein